MYSEKTKHRPFFTRFNFFLSHRPVLCNVKPDALSRQFLEGEDLATWSEPSSLQGHHPHLGDRGEYGPPPRTNLATAPALLIACSFPQTSGPTFFCGPTLQVDLPSRDPEDLGRPSAAVMVAHRGGGHRESVNACPTCSQHKPSHQDLAGLFSLSLCLIAPGPTSPWTLSWVSPHLMATRSSSQE